MTLSNHQRLMLVARLQCYSIDNLFRLSRLAMNEMVELEHEWAMLRMTVSQHSRWIYVHDVFHIVDAEIQRFLATPIRRWAISDSLGVAAAT